MIDLHSHILYEIDDGSKSLEMSLEMLRIAAASGVTDIFATPHVNRRGKVPQWEQILQRKETLQRQADAAAISIAIHSGAEVELNYDTLRFLPEQQQAYCLADSSYILLELTSQSQPDQVESLLFELMLRGYMPILAHPERYERIMAHPDRLLRWMQRGVLTQCNIGSFNGAFGKDAQRRAELLLDNHMIYFLGSDAHRTDWRNPDITAAEKKLRKLAGGEKLFEKCQRNAAQLLRGKLVYPEVPDRFHKPKRSFLAKSFSRNPS